MESWEPSGDPATVSQLLCQTHYVEASVHTEEGELLPEQMAEMKTKPPTDTH